MERSNQRLSEACSNPDSQLCKLQQFKECKSLPLNWGEPTFSMKHFSVLIHILLNSFSSSSCQIACRYAIYKSMLSISCSFNLSFSVCSLIRCLIFLAFSLNFFRWALSWIISRSVAVDSWTYGLKVRRSKVNF
jgi:hypothetical protein